MNLRQLLADVAADPGDGNSLAAVTGPSGEVTWSSRGRPFAVLGGDGTVAEFALDAAVAAAAARTPDVTLSGRGPGWVRFRPLVLDDHGADRVAAWFASAHRRASTG